MHRPGTASVNRLRRQVRPVRCLSKCVSTWIHCIVTFPDAMPTNARYQYCNPINSSNPTSVAGGINVGWDCLNQLSFSKHGGGGHPPPNFPLQCSAGFSGYEGYCFSGGSTQPVKTASLAECCESATKSDAHSWTYVNGTCQTFQYGAHASHCVGGVSGMHKYTPHPQPGPPPPPPCNCKRMNQTMGLRNMSGYSRYGGSHFGIWYSNPAMGECTGSHKIGDGSGCTWKLRSIDKAINASCLYERIDTNIEVFDSDAKACFAACPGTPPTLKLSFYPTSSLVSRILGLPTACTPPTSRRP